MQGQTGGANQTGLMAYTHLTSEQRAQIELLHKEGHSRAEIGRRLGRHETTIGREIKRRGGKRVYNAERAHLEAVCMRRVARRPTKWTAGLAGEMECRMAEGHSPQQIAGRWKREGRCRKSWLSAEAIYRRVAEDRRRGGELYRLLRRGGRRRRNDRCGTRRGHSLKVRPDQESGQRPQEINDRSRAGDWEVDLIVGAGQRGIILVAVERVTRYCCLRLLPDNSAPVVSAALIGMLKDMPLASLTKDRGLEWAEHEKIAQRLNVEVYFCRPYHSWEKGLVEQHNGLLREFWPKHLALDTLTPQAVSRAEARRNARARRVLGYATPAERMLKVA